MKRLIVLVLTVSTCSAAMAQENSPYSRYGIGDLAPNHNIVNRGMGGISAGTADFQSINFVNPASYASLAFLDTFELRTRPNAVRGTIFDVGAEVDVKTLKSQLPAKTYTATNLPISYLQLAIPIKMKKLNKQGLFWAATIGLKPVSRINYKIASFERLTGVDSISTIYEGSGGLSEVYFGSGFQYKKFSVGFNFGYLFGNKNYSTNRLPLNDSISYYEGYYSDQTNFGGTFIDLGVQYEVKLKNRASLRIGAYGNLKRTLSASNNTIRQTVGFDASNNQYKIDSVFERNDVKGNVEMPASLGFGFNYTTGFNPDKPYASNWTFGVDYEATQWADYRFYGKADAVQNSWKIKAGAGYIPNSNSLRKYFRFVQYRFGFFYGNDYIKVKETLPEYGFTFGAGFPLKLRKLGYETQSTMLNTAVEFISRGDNKSNLKESLVRISFSISLADLWFRRYKYD